MSELVKMHPQHALAEIGSEPHVFHCHHYNCFLQKTIFDQNGLVAAESILTNSAALVVAAQMAALNADIAVASDLFRTLGFGVIDLSKISINGGIATVAGSHYAMGWLSKFGKSNSPVCYFPAGFVEAFARHTHKKAFEVREVECVAQGGNSCRFELKPGGQALAKSPGMGTLSNFGPRPSAATNTSVDEAAIVAACAGLPLGGNAVGQIPAFGVSLTRHYANYYNLVSYGFDQQMIALAGEAAAMAARMLLIEAGHVCAFHTFGGIMESAEWDALIKPQCKTHDDWAYGLVSVINALGWGRWSIAKLVPGRSIEMVVDGSYESNGYLGLYGASTTPRCYLATGGTAGLMNLLYNADITKRPSLTSEFYEQTFNSGALFTATEVECRTMGAPACRFVAERM